MISRNEIEDPVFTSVLEKVLCQKSFYHFVKTAWQYVDATPYIDNWHIECMCVHLQALYEFKFPVLDVTIPPSFAKSLLCSVMFPVWVWLQDPTTRFLTGSHDMELAIRDTLKSRYFNLLRVVSEKLG